MYSIQVYIVYLLSFPTSQTIQFKFSCCCFHVFCVVFVLFCVYNIRGFDQPTWIQTPYKGFLLVKNDNILIYLVWSISLRLSVNVKRHFKKIYTFGLTEKAG